MIDPERLAAFTLMTGATSLVPGLSMMFVMGQTVRGGWRSGALALAGMQIGYAAWWVVGGLGLGTLATAWPLAFRGLAIGGAGYLGWLGLQAVRRAGEVAGDDGGSPSQGRSPRAFRDGILVSLGNPKCLVYIVALLPPFVDSRSPVIPQFTVLWFVGMVLDVAIGALYIGAGGRLARAMHRVGTRRRVDLAVGATYLLIAAGVLFDTLLR